MKYCLDASSCTSKTQSEYGGKLWFELTLDYEYVVVSFCQIYVT